MIKEIKQLYKKDKKLAIEVAQVLGYKIKARKYNFNKDVMRKIEDAYSFTEHAVESLFNIVKSKEVDFPDKFKKSFVEAEKSLLFLRKNLPKHYKGLAKDKD